MESFYERKITANAGREETAGQYISFPDVIASDANAGLAMTQ